MNDNNPILIVSEHSKQIIQDGITIELCIYRLEDNSGWTLEVVNYKGTSLVWDDVFPSDDAAFQEYQRTVRDEGMKTFLDDGNVIKFPR